MPAQCKVKKLLICRAGLRNDEVSDTTDDAMKN